MTRQPEAEPPRQPEADVILCAVCSKLCDGIHDVMVHAPHGNFVFCDWDCANIWKMREAELHRTGTYHWWSDIHV